MNYAVKELRIRTGLSQKKFADLFGIPVSTLRKWEQGEAAPPKYVIELITKALPVVDSDLEQIDGRNGIAFYYDKQRNYITDIQGNKISISESLDEVNKHNLKLYVSDMFDSFYKIQKKFNRDCHYDKLDHIVWSEEFPDE